MASRWALTTIAAQKFKRSRGLNSFYYSLTEFFKHAKGLEDVNHGTWNKAGLAQCSSDEADLPSFLCEESEIEQSREKDNLATQSRLGVIEDNPYQTSQVTTESPTER